jgi:hypothetical protein
LIGVGAATAQEAQAIASSIFPGSTLVASEVDLSGDGLTEIFVGFPFECEGASCRWSILGKGAEGWSEIGAGMAEGANIQMFEDGPAVAADGVFWRASAEEGQFPVHDMLEGEFGPAGESELLAAYESLGLTAGLNGPPAGYAARFDIDANGAQELVLAVSEAAWMLEGSFAPFVVFDSLGAPLAQGYSSDVPRIYRDGLSIKVVSVTPSGPVVETLAVQ